MPGATPTTTRTDRRAAANRAAILAAAEELLVERGEAGLTVDAVAERADVAIQTVYNRVGTRSAVLMAVAERALEQNRVFMDAAYASAGTPLERLRLVGNAYFRFATESPHQFRLLNDPPRLPEALAGVAALTREQNGKLAELLRDGAADGSMRADLDPEVTADLLWTAMNGFFSLGWRADELRADDARMRELRRTFDALVVRGLAPQGA